MKGCRGAFPPVLLTFAAVVLLMTACASHKTAKPEPPVKAVSTSTVAVVPDGIVKNEKGYAMKVQSKSFIDVVDMLCYMKRISYTFATDVPVSFLTIGDASAVPKTPWAEVPARQFKDLTEILDYIVMEANKDVRPAGCYPKLCTEDIVDRDHFADTLLASGDPLSLKIATERRQAIALLQRYAYGTPEELQLLNRKAREAGSAENVRLAGRKDLLLAELAKTAEPTEATVQKVRGALLDDLTAELLDEVNRFIDAPGTGQLALFDPYQTDPVRKLLAGGPVDAATLRQVRRFLVEQIYGDALPARAKLRYRFVGDGIEFYRTRSMFLPEPKEAFKKSFLFNLTTAEAMEKLSNLYGLEVPPTPSELEKPIERRKVNPANVIMPLPTQNALVIKSSRAVIDQISQTIFAMDSKYDMVMVETKVFEYDDSLSQKIGSAIEYSKELSGTSKVNVSTFFGEGIVPTAMPIFAFGKTDTERKLNLLGSLALFGRDGVVRIAAEPRLVLKPGASADIKLASVKYVLTNASATVAGALEPVSTGVAFTITPTILSDRKIMLQTMLEQSEFVPNVEQNITLTTNKNTVNTTIIVNNGELVSIGGIKAKKQSTFTSGIPYLKDLPLVGWLFGSRADDSHLVSIEFMIRPTIKYTREAAEELMKEAAERDDKALATLHTDPDELNRELNAEVSKAKKN